MPYFKIVVGEFTQLCVYDAEEKLCLEPKCEFLHEPRSRGICPMYHNPRKRCPFNPYLFEHNEARDAPKAAN
jgi:hypothetical protein